MKKTTKFSLLGLLAVALFAAGWTSAGDVKITGSLLSKVQRFYGTTGTNFIKVPDNLASALVVEDYENGGDLITVATTDSSELISVVKPLAVTSTLALSGALSAPTGTFTGPVSVSGTLSVTGATTFVGAVTHTAPNIIGVGAAVSAAGSAKTDCTALTKEFNSVTGTALQGVCLATAVAGKHQAVFNDSAVALVAYPADADNAALYVNDLGAMTSDQGYVIGPQASLDCTAYTAAKWRCTYVPGSRATVAAAGTNQATGTALASVNMGSFVAVTAADATKAVTLPTGGSTSTYAPGCISIQSTVNTNTAYLPVFGHNSDDDTINGAAADAVFTMGAGALVRFCSLDGIAWTTR